MHEQHRVVTPKLFILSQGFRTVEQFKRHITDDVLRHDLPMLEHERLK
jgi:hypothetical protein